MESFEPCIALVGNPNTGKTTLFNALTGLHQHVGNYPGVTIDWKLGSSKHGDVSLRWIDLPGTYSLAARSPDEMVTVNLLLGLIPEQPKPDVILSIVDAANLDRHLYLTTQLMDVGLPVVVAVNLIDLAEKQGIRIDYAKLSEKFGCPILPIRANKGIGLDALKDALIVAARTKPTPLKTEMPAELVHEAEALSQILKGESSFLTQRLLLDIQGHTERQLAGRHGEQVIKLAEEARARLRTAGIPIPAVEAKARFGRVRLATAESVIRGTSPGRSSSDRIDHVLTHRVWGTLIFLALMFCVFEAIYVGASPLMDWIGKSKDWAAERVNANLPLGPLRSLLADGVIKGIGGILVFLPQIMILFGFIAVLEDCGYMARAAFLMDRIMARCGLNGKSFIPLLSSVACAVPGIMATRVIENRRDRLATILVAPLMSCSARLPLYMLLIGAFLSDPWWLPGVALFGMYMVGFITAPLVALVLKRTLLRGAPPLFVMEMPAYKMPQFWTILRRMLDAGWAFVHRAGTIILATMILVWALLYFPAHDAEGRSYPERIEQQEIDIQSVTEQRDGLEPESPELESLSAEIEQKETDKNTLYGEWKRTSYLGRAGVALEPAFRPLGWDWRITMAALASFPAREVVVGTLGIIYNLGEVDTGSIRDSEKPGDTPLGKTLREEWTTQGSRVPLAVGLMIFFALCCQCASTLAVIRRETRSWAWPAFTFVYMTVLAYLGALVTYQVGRLIGL